MDKISIRPGTRQDRDILIQFEIGLQDAVAAMSTYKQPFSKEDAGRYVDWIYGEMEKKTGLSLIAEAARQPVGFIAGWIEEMDEDDRVQYKREDRRYGYIAEAFTVLEYRGQKIYGLLVEQLEKHFQKHGISWVRVNTMAQNDALQHSAKRQGYTPFMVTLAKSLAA